MFHVEHSHRDGRWIFLRHVDVPCGTLAYGGEEGDWKSELEVGESNALESQKNGLFYSIVVI